MHGEAERVRRLFSLERRRLGKDLVTVCRQLSMMECVRERQAMVHAISGGPFQPQPFGDSKQDTHEAGRVPSPTGGVGLPAGTS